MAIEKEKTIEESPGIRTNVSRETFSSSSNSFKRENSFLAEKQNAEDLLALQLRLWDLLDSRVKRYTSGESSSLPLLTAHEMLASVLFVLGLDNDKIDQSDIKHLLTIDLGEEFKQRLKTIQAKTKQVGYLWKEVVLDTPLLESRALTDTLNSLKNFEAQYNSLYFAHEIPVDIDYPLCNPVPEDYQGIKYVHEYLWRLKLENNFLNKFDVSLCRALLKKFAPDYRELIINLYEPVAVNAIGLALVGERPQRLQVSIRNRQAIIAQFENVSSKEACERLAEAATLVLKNLKIENNEEQTYLQRLAVSLYPRIKALAPRGDLSGIFLSFS